MNTDIVTALSEASVAAKRAARIITVFYIPSMPPELLERHGVDLEGIQPINDPLPPVTWPRRSS